MTLTFALQIAAGRLEPSESEAEQATSERMAILSLATELGMLEDQLLAALTSSQWTRYKARAVVSYAQSKVARLLSAATS